MSEGKKLYNLIAEAFYYISNGYKFEIFMSEENFIGLK